MTRDDLVAASKHLVYEIEMLFGTARELRTSHSEFVTNALVESFTIHGRVLYSFFFGCRRFDDDILASDYVQNWENTRPDPMPPALKELDWRVGKEIAHLTSKRLSITEADKQWDCEALVEEYRHVLSTFLNSLSDANATAELLRLKTTLTSPEYASVRVLRTYRPAYTGAG
ncbi:MAG: hypothetical protein ACHRXM_09345 [Isosphaerales bacterium]